MAVASTSASHNGFRRHSWATLSPNTLCLDQLTTQPLYMQLSKSMPTLYQRQVHPCLCAWQKVLERATWHPSG